MSDQRAGAWDEVLGVDLDAATVADLAARLDDGSLTAVDLAAAYLRRVRRLDGLLAAVIVTSPWALAEAAASDRRRAAGAPLGPLDGIPYMVKDNIDVAGFPTTAGSRAMTGTRPERDAPVVAALRAAGAVLLAKTNLSEWANFRSSGSTSGWSAVGGLTVNPYALDRNACGSSTGSAVAVAASLTQLAIGTETDGSIVCPASTTGTVGVKPTLGLLSGSGIVPISTAQDTAGPMARTVADAALMLAAMRGEDPVAPAPDRLRGARLGVWRPPGTTPVVDDVLAAALGRLRRAGAVLVPVDLPVEDLAPDEMTALTAECRRDLEAYLAATPGDHPRDVAGILAFDEADRLELAHFGHDLLVAVRDSPAADDEAMVATRRRVTAAARAMIDGPMADHDLAAIVSPTCGPGWLNRLDLGDPLDGPWSNPPAAVAGYPAVTVPMGLTAGSPAGLPVGLSFVGRAWSEPLLLDLAAGFERAAAARRPPTYAPTLG